MTLVETWDPKKTQQLLCVCQHSVFTIVIDPEGVVCICQSCNKQYRLQSLGGLRISNA